MGTHFTNLTSIGSSLAVSIAAIITAFVAIRATTQWKTQKKIQIEHDLAIEILTLLYRFEDAIKEFRNGFAHLEVKEDRSLTKEQQEFAAWQDLYSKRGALVTEASGSIKALSHHAKAIWDELLSPDLTEVFNSQLELFWSAHDFLQSRNPSLTEYERDTAKPENDLLKVLYRMGSEDEFERKIHDVIEAIAQKLRPKMIT